MRWLVADSLPRAAPAAGWNFILFHAEFGGFTTSGAVIVSVGPRADYRGLPASIQWPAGNVVMELAGISQDGTGQHGTTQTFRSDHPHFWQHKQVASCSQPILHGWICTRRVRPMVVRPMAVVSQYNHQVFPWNRENGIWNKNCVQIHNLYNHKQPK